MKNPTLPTSPRDGRLDVLRGLCLLNMVLIHILEQGLVVPGLFRETAVYWLRFAAGGFVLCSGLCIGVIHYKRALLPEKRAGVYSSLLKRAGVVLLVHYFASILSLVMIPIHGQPLENVPKMLWDILLFYSGYDLLLFYVFMLAVSPLLIEITRRAGVLVMLAISCGFFLYRYDNPYLGLWSIENHFPLLRWQLIFVIGLLMGVWLPKFDSATVKQKYALLAGSFATAMMIGLLSSLERHQGVVLPWYLTVSKFPLSPLEVVRYVALALALAVTVDRLWPWVGRTWAERFLATVGVNSLMLWIAHTPIIANLVTFPWLIALVLSALGVWLAAVIANGLWKAWESSRKLPKLSYVFPVVGSLVLSAVLLQMETPMQISTADTGDDLPLFDESSFFDEYDDVTPIPIDEDWFDSMARLRGDLDAPV